ncbi:hypothetical protein [Sphingobium yanoikuyae]|nr:hypothetical protein [Sphingobium yanoikuyae]
MVSIQDKNWIEAKENDMTAPRDRSVMTSLRTIERMLADIGMAWTRDSS